MNAATQSPSQKRTACLSLGMAAITAILLVLGDGNSASAQTNCGCTAPPDNRQMRWVLISNQQRCVRTALTCATRP